MDEDSFLHDLAKSLADDAAETCKAQGIDLTVDGKILHLGQAFMLVLAHRAKKIRESSQLIGSG
jgi:hypothetical protein